MQVNLNKSKRKGPRNFLRITYFSNCQNSGYNELLTWIKIHIFISRAKFHAMRSHEGSIIKEQYRAISVTLLKKVVETLYKAFLRVVNRVKNLTENWRVNESCQFIPLEKRKDLLIFFGFVTWNRVPLIIVRVLWSITRMNAKSRGLAKKLG